MLATAKRRRRFPVSLNRCVVYALLEPVSGEVRYVGCTHNILRRYKQHINKACMDGRERGSPLRKSKWVASLLRQGFIPGLLILQVVASKKANECEQKWVMYYSANGHRITNWTWNSGERPHLYQI